MRVFIQAKALWRLGRPAPWIAPTIVTLGVTTAILEGVGLVLFIPLLKSLGAPSSGQAAADRILTMASTTFGPSQVTAVIVVLLCASIVLKNMVALANTWVTRFVNGDVAHRVRNRIFDQSLSSCIDFRPGVRRADLATTMSTESWNVSRGLAMLFGMAVSLITALVFIGLMLTIAPLLTFLSLSLLLIAGFIVKFATQRAAATGRAVVEENRRFGLRMWESIQSLQLIRAFSRERYERQRFEGLSDRLRRRMLKLEMLWAVPGPIAEISIICLIGVLVLVAHDARIGIAELAAFLSLLYRLQGPVRELLQSTVALDSLSGSVEDVACLLRDTRDPHLVDGTTPAKTLRSSIVLDRVSFRYGPGDPWALEDVSFQIPVGKTTAIVGESGAGKSTLMALLFRFQDPSAGTITIDGVPLHSLELASWRNRLSLMAQEVQLFNDTIAFNIAYGRAGARDTEIRTAARLARANEFIESLPAGYDTIVGDQGLRLSGGQRQRIALSRTILRDPDILLLDEATNALDVESEQAFQLALEGFSERRTVIVIAHRLSTIRNADQVILLGHGRVIEAGPPDQLLRQNGQFARLYALQHGPLMAAAGG
jgi:subfamily B ATP-binding cassette protein MsbA